MKKNRGITLVALVITIIILLILAGITISQLTDSGLFGYAKLAKERYENAQRVEEESLDEYQNMINNLGSSRDVDIQQLKKDLEDLKKELEELKTIPILYENSDGWNSGSITVNGISKYEEIGVYLSGRNDDNNSNLVMVRCTLYGNNRFVGTALRTDQFTNNSATWYSLEGPTISLSISNDTLTYGSGAKFKFSSKDVGSSTFTTEIPRISSKVYKIVGLTKKASIQ